MATRKRTTRPVSVLLAKEMPGETPPEEDRLALAVRASLGVSIIEPWNSLNDGHVFAFDSESGQRWYCLVMGTLGEVFAIQAYRGDAGFALFDDIQRDRITDTSDFLARQDLFTIEFVRRAELSPVDRAILALFPEPIPHGRRVPQFTVSRPRQFRWYPNAVDLEEINDCLMASLLFFEWLAKHRDIDPWAKDGEMPLLLNWVTDLTIQQIPHPPPPPPRLEVPEKLDERAVNQVLTTLASRKAGAALEADVFLFRSPIRGNGRPFFPWAALACDAATGFVFAPSLRGIEQKRADALAKGVLDALRQSPFRPKALHVGTEANRVALESLAQIMGIPLKITKTPAVAEARAALERQMRR